ncbi:START domain-containing protein [Agitococcus lubricus]|uniref:START domain-containing protein n=1 Tax=Agitococcus lubricus TaxID=1077255 RepID=A0A2T5IYZ6_9GAMM|nr:START domain-containing protein [Agitococcus lubricus]PTQ89151.1 START domain-containing protein [Agitococcus lubricus]
MRKLLTTVILALGISGLSTTVSADVDDELLELRGTQAFNEWILVKHDTKRNIKAYSKREDGKRIRSFKLDYLIDAPLVALGRVYLDIDNYTRWFWEVRNAKVLKIISPTEFYYYIQHDAPVTLPDRDAIIHATIEPYTRKKGFAALKLKAVPDFIPEKPPLVRMLAEDMVLKFTPINKEQVRVEVEGYIDPGGMAPTWAVNAVQKQAPYYTVVGLQRMVQQVKNQGLPPDFPFKILEEEVN